MKSNVTGAQVLVARAATSPTPAWNYRLADVVGKKQSDGTRGGGFIPVSPATIWRWVRSGVFPRPIRLSPGVTVWRGADLIAFIENSSRVAK